jgi:hypothetical protein
MLIKSVVKDFFSAEPGSFGKSLTLERTGLGQYGGNGQFQITCSLKYATPF